MPEYTNEDMFDRACQRLEKISALKEKHLLDDSEYKDIKAEILSQMK